MSKKTNPLPEGTTERADNLDLFLDREAILLGGDQASGKTYSVAALVRDLQEVGHNVVVIDRDRGMAKVIREMFGKTLPDNLDYFLGSTWDKIEKAMDHAMATLGKNDWLVFEQAGRFWDMAQEEFGRRVYGSLTEHLLVLRADAEDEVRARGLGAKDKEANKLRASKVGFQGMEGRMDWPVIKRMHNSDVFDRAILDGQFNVLATTSMTPLTDEDIKARRWLDFHNIGARPEGEKHQVYRFDTVALVSRKDGQYTWRTELGGGKGKDRGGRKLLRDMDCTDVGLVASYLAAHNLEYVR